MGGAPQWRNKPSWTSSLPPVHFLTFTSASQSEPSLYGGTRVRWAVVRRSDLPRQGSEVDTRSFQGGGAGHADQSNFILYWSSLHFADTTTHVPFTVLLSGIQKPV